MKHQRGGTILGSTNRANSFHYEVATNGQVNVFDVSETVIHRAREYGIEVLLVSDPCNMNYLTGYDATSYYVHQMVALAIDAAEPRTVTPGARSPTRPL